MKRVQSFEDARRKRSRILRLVRYVALLFVAFEAFSAFALKAWVVGSSSMSPTLEPKDRVIVAASAYGIFNPLSGARKTLKAPERGDVVLMRLPSSTRVAWHRRFVDSLFRFLSLQRADAPGLRPVDGSPVIKRVIARPGDSVMMDGFVAYVKVSGSSHFLTEYEVSGGDYGISGGKLIDDWGKDMPLSGTMKPIELGPGEYFVIGDNRFSSADSRFFGAVDEGRIVGKVIARYWPLDRLSGF